MGPEPVRPVLESLRHSVSLSPKMDMKHWPLIWECQCPSRVNEAVNALPCGHLGQWITMSISTFGFLASAPWFSRGFALFPMQFSPKAFPETMRLGFIQLCHNWTTWSTSWINNSFTFLEMYLILLLIFVALGVEPRAFHMSHEHCTSERYPSSLFIYFYFADCEPVYICEVLQGSSKESTV